jgi:hypothetical protein
MEGSQPGPKEYQSDHYTLNATAVVDCCCGIVRVWKTHVKEAIAMIQQTSFFLILLERLELAFS